MKNKKKLLLQFLSKTLGCEYIWQKATARFTYQGITYLKAIEKFKAAGCKKSKKYPDFLEVSDFKILIKVVPPDGETFSHFYL